MNDTTQLGLFSTVPYVRKSDTSKAAAMSLSEGQRRSQRRKIWECLRRDGDLTDQQIHEHTGIEENSVRPRRGELEAAGLVVDSGARRMTKSGHLAAVRHALDLDQAINGQVPW